MELGYTRVSTRGQKADSQIARLEAAGCERIFVDHGYSGRLDDRPEWNKCREMQRQGDRLMIPALDRVAGTDTIAEIARTFGVGASSVSRALAKHDE